MSIFFWSVKILLEYRLIIVEIQILRLLIVPSTPNQCNNRKILHFQFTNRKRRNFTVIISGIVQLLVSPAAYRGVV